jgi:hypothetical protein
LRFHENPCISAWSAACKSKPARAAKAIDLKRNGKEIGPPNRRLYAMTVGMYEGMNILISYVAMQEL